MLPKSGDVLHITRAASVQFIKPIMFRVIRVHHDWITYDGWLWLDGYELDSHGDAVDRRSIFVQRAGLRLVNLQLPTPGARATARAAGSRDVRRGSAATDKTRRAADRALGAAVDGS